MFGFKIGSVHFFEISDAVFNEENYFFDVKLVLEYDIHVILNVESVEQKKVKFFG